MATYLQQLNQYNRYQRMIPTIKSAELTDARSWWGLGGKTGAQYFTEDNEGWSNEEAFQALLGTLPPEVQQEYATSGAAQNINGLFAQALANPQKYSNLLTYAAQDQQLALQGKRSALSTVLEQNPFAKQVVSQIKDGVQNNIDNGKGLRGTISRIGHYTGFAATKDQIGNAPVEEVQKYMNGTAPQQGQPQQTQSPSGQAPATQPNGAQAGGSQQNPSMWNYMLPALAAGAPLALLGGLGGGSKWGLGLLGLTGLAGLGYGMARQNGWEGWDPINNFANTINGWLGMGNNQTNTPNQNTYRPPTAQEINAPGAYHGGPGDIIDNSKVPGNVSYEAMDNPEDFGLDPNQSWQMSIGPGDRYITNGNGTTYFTSSQTVANQGKIRQDAMKNPAGTSKPSAGVTPPATTQPNPGAGTNATTFGPQKPKTAEFLPNLQAAGTGYTNLKKVTAPANQRPAPQQAPQKPTFNPRMIGTGYQNFKQMTQPTAPQQAPTQQKPTFNPRMIGTGYQNFKQMMQSTQQQTPQQQTPQQPPAQNKQNPKSVWPWGVSPSALRI